MTEREVQRLRERDRVFTEHIKSLRDIAYDDLSKSWKVTLMQGVLNDLEDALRRIGR